MKRMCYLMLSAILGLTLLSGCGQSAGPAGDTQTTTESETSVTETTEEPKAFVEPEYLKGVMFSPNLQHSWSVGYPFIAFHEYTDDYRAGVRTHLSELSEKGFNYIAVYLCNLHTMRIKEGNKAGQPIEEWGNFDYLDSFVVFLEDCCAAGISVQVDLVDNRWMPYSYDTQNHLAKPDGWWPVADEDPWDEAATWYSEVIEYIEAKVSRPEVIAAWAMQGNYQFGAAEPKLWFESGTEGYQLTEQFVKYVWPVFAAAGSRPKASPYMLPIFSSSGEDADKTPDERLQAFINLKKWLADDLGLPPDYWMMTSYAYCDPAQDGFCYFARICEILTDGNDGEIISTDLKCVPGHLSEVAGTIVYTPGKDMADCIEWHLQKAEEYGFKGWWIWNYQDTRSNKQGIRSYNGNWKDDVLAVIDQYTGAGGE